MSPVMFPLYRFGGFLDSVRDSTTLASDLEWLPLIAKKQQTLFLGRVPILFSTVISLSLGSPYL